MQNLFPQSTDLVLLHSCDPTPVSIPNVIVVYDGGLSNVPAASAAKKIVPYGLAHRTAATCRRRHRNRRHHRLKCPSQPHVLREHDFGRLGQQLGGHHAVSIESVFFFGHAAAATSAHVTAAPPPGTNEVSLKLGLMTNIVLPAFMVHGFRVIPDGCEVNIWLSRIGILTCKVTLHLSSIFAGQKT